MERADDRRFPGSPIRPLMCALTRLAMAPRLHLGLALRGSLVVLAMLLGGGSAAGSAPERPLHDDEVAIAPEIVRTGSMRETLMTLERLALSIEHLLSVYKDRPEVATYDQIRATNRDIVRLFDLSGVPASMRHEVGIETAAATLDILRRITPPPEAEIPHLDDADLARWRIPETPLVIARVESGVQAGEYLFTGRTVTSAPEFAARIRHLPVRSPFEIESLTELGPQIHGPLIPSFLTSNLPEWLQTLWLGTPVWKTALVLVFVLLAMGLLGMLYRLTRLSGGGNKRFQQSILGLVNPIASILVLRMLQYLIRYEINVQGGLARAVDVSISLALFIAVTWLVWVIAVAVVELVIRSPKIADQGIDANLLRLAGRVIGVIAIIVLWLRGAEDLLGIPAAGLITGLGVGGIAVALAVRPTLENLIGGFILYLDKPIQVGDFCGFLDREGTIEKIGARSTQIRGLDRTLTSVPNAQFVDMQLTNWASCDRMQIMTTIGLRYETEPDQLRWVLAKLREMCHAHPKIDRGTVRIRFVGHGESSLDIQMRIYALTREWNEFFAIREDILLRVNEVVAKSGTGFAFPSQTVYYSQDAGVDPGKSGRAMEDVALWRSSRRLPFPTFSESRMDELAGTLDYPPRGSMIQGDGSATPGGGEELEPLSSPESRAEESDTASPENNTPSEGRA